MPDLKSVVVAGCGGCERYEGVGRIGAERGRRGGEEVEGRRGEEGQLRGMFASDEV